MRYFTGVGSVWFLALVSAVVLTGCGRGFSTKSQASKGSALPAAAAEASNFIRSLRASSQPIPAGGLQIVNYGSQLGAVAAGSIINAYGSGLASVNYAQLAVQSGSYGYPVTYETYAATIFEASNDRVSLILPSISVPVDWWSKLQLYHQDGSGARTLVAEQNFYVESAAPGFLMQNQASGVGTPIGNVTYVDPSWRQSYASFNEPLHAVGDGEHVILTLWGTGAIPVGCDNSAVAVATVKTDLGSANVPIAYLGTAGAGYQQINIDLTDFLRSDIARTHSARLYLRVRACAEAAPDGHTYWVDSNDVTLTLYTTDDQWKAPPPENPWPALAAQAPQSSYAIGGDHLNSVKAWADSIGPWEYRAQSVRNGLLRGADLLPLPAKTPLNPIHSRARMRDGYSVENVAFEASPGFFVTGNLFRPLHRSGPAPGILVAHGHFGDWAGYARTREENQLLATRLAQMGAVVFAYDMVGWGDSQQIDHRDDGHSFKDGTHNNLLKLQLWDSIRSLDFLESLQASDGSRLVDSTRLAVTGASGGATQALYLAAVDPRISAAAEVVMVTAGFTGDDSCEDGMPVHDVAGQQKTNNTEIAATIAPKPVMVLSNSDDWTQWFPQDEYPYLKKVYGLYGQADHAVSWHYHDGHNYLFSKRSRAYAFLSAALALERLPDGGGLPGDTDNHEHVTLERQTSLRVFTPAVPKPAIPMSHL